MRAHRIQYDGCKVMNY